MNITVTLDQEDVERMLVEQHYNVYGPPPAGEKWECTGLCGGAFIQNAPIEQATTKQPITSPAPSDSSPPF